MILLGPRPLILGVYHLPLTQKRQYWTRSIPPGAPWRLKYLTMTYIRSTQTVDGLVSQITPDLKYTLFDSKGNAFQVSPVYARQVTTPSGGVSVSATNPIDESYAGSDTLKILIEGQRLASEGANPGPAWVSLTFMGIRGWETMGGR